MIVRILKDWNYRCNHLIRRSHIGKSWKVSYRVTFDHSCAYMLSANQTQVNKLFGIGQINHHWQSMRIGWRWDVEKSAIELVAYWYENKKRDYIHLCYVKLYKPVDMMVSVDIVDGAVLFRCYADENYITRVFHIKNKWQSYPLFYECFPYFGGYMPAPQNVEIKMERI